MMIKLLFKTLVVAGFALFYTGAALAQGVEKKRDDLYLKGVDLFEKGLYTDAEDAFLRASKETDPADAVTFSQIAYYRAMCAIELRQKNMENKVYELIDNFPENKNINEVMFALANHFYQEKNFKKSVHWYEEVDSRSLRYKQHIECTFKKGHSYFELGSYNKALNCFIEVKDVPNDPYSAPATYYYGHTEYRKGNFISAQLAFEKILHDNRFAALASFYLVQIYYHFEEYDEAVKVGIAFLEKGAGSNELDIVRLVSESYFHLKNYDKAREYFNRYAQGNPELSRNDEYFMGMLEAQTGNHENAINYFNRVGRNKRDTLAQNALYQVGTIYLSMNDKNRAQNAFDLATRQAFDPVITKDALFQYAKLSLELQNNGEPLKRYFDRYPDEAKKPELKAHSASLNIAQRNYKQAIEDLLLISNLTDMQKADLQRLNFIVGKHIYETRDTTNFHTAIHYFDASLEGARYNATLEALAKYYKADTYFELGYYKEAQKQYEEFLKGSGAFLAEGEYIAAHYNLGYCYFNFNLYDAAITWFSNFIKVAGESYTEHQADAYNCIGDCNFIKKNYWPAAENYNKAIELKGSKSDYSMFQKAIVYGLLGRNNQKIETLNSLVTTQPNSSYATRSLLEIGRVYLQENQYSQAEKSFLDLINKYPRSPYIPQGYLELGLIYSNTNRLEEAIKYYKEAAQRARPNSEDANSAMVGLLNAYTDLGNLSEYYAYAQSINMENSTREEKEQALFLNAERLANSNSYEQAVTAFQKFLEEFSDSKYTQQAHYYLANCLMHQNNYKEAIAAYMYLIDDPAYNIYKEQSLYKSSQANAALNNYPAAIANLNELVNLTSNKELQLTAYIDIARIQFDKLKDFQKAIDAAQLAILSPAVSEQQTREMKRIKANSLDLLGNLALAVDIYNEIIYEHINDEANAEAVYNVIHFTFLQDNFEEGERMVIEFSKSPANTYQYWSARCFMELADQYAKHGNVPQAKATYNSILKGYKNKDDGILTTIRKQLDLLK